jgi:GNAT superfamily N-acetyltransferase
VPRPPAPVARPAEPSDRRLLADVLARAFWDDPIATWLLPRDRSRYHQLKVFFDAELGSYAGRNEILTTTDLSAAALWARPNQWRTPVGEILRAGLPLLWAMGTRSAMGLRFLARLESIHPTDEHWYLGVVGADPARRGIGAGRAVIDAGLERCDDDGLPAYLESSKAANVPYYERFGFRVTSELAYPGGPTLWPMWRDPR